MTNRLAFFTLTVFAEGIFHRRRLCDEHTCNSASPRTYRTRKTAFTDLLGSKTERVLLPMAKNRSVLKYIVFFPRLKHIPWPAAIY